MNEKADLSGLWCALLVRHSELTQRCRSAAAATAVSHPPLMSFRWLVLPPPVRHSEHSWWVVMIQKRSIIINNNNNGLKTIASSSSSSSLSQVR
jgi:hypothetical protein